MLNKLLRYIQKGFRIVSRRLREQGLITTLKWIYGRGLAKLTGVPPLRYSRVDDTLYIGPQYNLRGKQFLQRHGITAGVNLRGEYDDAAYGLAFERYCHIPTTDDYAPTLDQLVQGANFIRAEIESGGTVYIHCAGGVGRAPTMAAAYLISNGMSADEALERLRRVRPFILLTSDQIEQLRAYETLVREAQPVS